MSKEEKKANKLAKKEAKEAKKEAKLAKANDKAAAKAEKKHKKAYDSFVKETEKKNEKLRAKATKDGKDFVPIAIPDITEYQTKKEIKAEKSMKKAYAAYVKKAEKKNAKAEKKSAKKGKPFVPAAILTEEEFIASAGAENKTKKIILMIILIILVWSLLYFAYTYYTYEYLPAHQETTVSEEAGAPNEYESYSNPHKITTTPNYSIADAKIFLQQTIKDNWNQLGYKSDPSNGAIAYNNRIETVNGAECYIFSCSGKTYAVSTKLSACYYVHDGQYTPVGFNDTDVLFKD